MWSQPCEEDRCNALLADSACGTGASSTLRGHLLSSVAYPFYSGPSVLPMCGPYLPVNARVCHIDLFIPLELPLTASRSLPVTCQEKSKIL